MKIIESLKKYSIATVIVSFLFGLVLLIFPKECKDAISLITGIALILFGAIQVLKFFIKDKSAGAVISGVFSIVLGIIICIGIIQVVDIIVGVIGVLLIVFGIIDLFIAIRLISASGIFGWISLCLSVLSMVFGAIAVSKTNEASEAVFRFLGIALIVYAILDLISYIQVKRFVKSVSDTIDEIMDDGTIEAEGTLIEDGDTVVENVTDAADNTVSDNAADGAIEVEATPVDE